MTERSQTRPRVGSWLGKYKLRKRIASGGFSDVYLAHDSVLGQRVALKIPQEGGHATREDFLHEIRLTAKLEHPNILPIRNADIIDGRLIVAYPLGETSLDERLTKRMSLERKLSYSGQLLEGLAHAHARRIVHCDVKPENIILFADDNLKLADFGIAKVAIQSIHGSSSGTLGYMAPEHALGRPSARSDVFSAGLVIFKIFTTHLPEWPFDWPPEGHARLRAFGPELTAVLRRSMEVRGSKRFRDAGAMLVAFRKAEKDVRRRARQTKKRRQGSTTRG